MLITFFKKIFGIEALEKRIRFLERKNYWREKYAKSNTRSTKA